MCESLDDTAIGRVVVDDVIRRSVGSEVVLHRLVGMTHGDVPETSVARDECCLEEKLQVEHVVDNHCKLPTVGRSPVPRTNAAHSLVVAGDECAGRAYHNIAIRLLTRQLPCFAERVVDHEAQIVTAVVHFHTLDGPRVADGLLAPEGIVAVLIHLPELTGEETTAPVGLAHHSQTAVALHAARHQRPVFLLGANLVGLSQLVAQLHVGTRKGVVGSVGGVIEQVEMVGEPLHEVLLGASQIVLALCVEQRQPIDVFCQLALFVVPLADLLIRPLADVLSQIGSQEVGSLPAHEH